MWLAASAANYIIQIIRKLTIRLVDPLQGKPSLIIWTWDTIRGFGATKALKTSYIFLFAVPILAGMLANIPKCITIPFWGKTIDIVLTLPFSWVALFICACLASLGNVIYSVMCPQPIKEFPDFPAFESAQRDGTYFRSIICKLALTPKDATISQQLSSVKELYNDIPIDLIHLEDSLNGKESLLPSEFYFVRDATNFGKPLSRLIATSSYLGAFACLIFIVIENIITVIKHYF